MRLVTFEVQTVLGRFERLGALAHETIVDLTSSYTAYLAQSGDLNAAQRAAVAVVPPDMIGFLEGAEVSRAAAEAAIDYVGQSLASGSDPRGPEGERLTFDRNDVRLLAPVPRPPMIRDGILILDHYLVGMERLFKIAEQDRKPEASNSMPIFWKPSRGSVAGPDDDVLWPKYSERLDYEFELGMYIGKRGKDIPVERAWDHVAGYTVFNDLGLRDIQPEELSLRMGPAKAKDFITSKVMGPCLVTADEMPDLDGLKLTTKVNDEVWFDGAITGWSFTFAELIAYVTRDEFVEVGDFFGSGPPAYSVGFEIDKWIKPGDVVSCEIEGIGVLSNRIVRAEA